MIVNDPASARAWLQAWGARAFKLGRAARAARDLRACAGLCGDRRPGDRASFLAAAKVIEDAASARRAP